MLETWQSDGNHHGVVVLSGGGGGGGSVTQGTVPWADNISQFGGVTVNLGQQTTAASIPVTLPSDGTLPLPAGAATSALQPTNAAQGSTTAGQTGPLTQGSVVGSPPVYTTGTTQPVTINTSGALRTNINGVFSSTGVAALQAFSASAAATNAAMGIAGVYLSTPATVANSNSIGIQTDNNGNIQTAPTRGVPTGCGLTTSATPGNTSTAISANLVNRHVMLQNNGTAAILFSFTVTTGLTATNSFSLSAGQTWTNPNSFVPTSALTVASGTASQPLMCEYN